MSDVKCPYCDHIQERSEICVECEELINSDPQTKGNAMPELNECRFCKSMGFGGCEMCTDSRSERDRLKSELERVKRENDILKKENERYYKELLYHRGTACY